ncbi:unnamed protein product [Macrosiphum euphorbiae]|uniref:Uncharacterized protein n=1 Tax=Macrosiphum euphorbiae TaxID=13131 RepID=A0AAV0WSC2_9HEMI|nr:unnamed protein product [Macrosiphum euphorbiae]
MRFDLEKALPLPLLTTSKMYYKRNMFVYNHGCQEMSSGIRFMHIWDETTASRGSQEIASCVNLSTRSLMLRHIVLYSDINYC